jgi:hypothetical protein
MGRGLGLLQSRILVMADVNRVGDGREIGRPSVYLTAPVHRPVVKEYYEALHTLRDKLSRTDWQEWDRTGCDRYHAMYIHNALWTTIRARSRAREEASKLAMEGAVENGPGGAIIERFLFFSLGDDRPSIEDSFQDAVRMAKETVRAIAHEHQVDLSGEGGDYDWRRGTYGWTVSEHMTVREAIAAHDEIVAKGVPAENVRIGISNRGDHLRMPEILADIYGFREHLLSEKDRASRRLFPGLLFDRQAIGERRYNAAIVAASKAVAALHRRDLIVTNDEVFIRDSTTSFSGHLSITLTAEGVAAAGAIKAKIPNIIKDLSFYNITT